MNTEKLIHLLFVFLSVTTLFSCITTDKVTRTNYSEIVLDEKYSTPVDISLDGLVTYEIIPLETTEKSLLDKDYEVQHIDSSLIIITNSRRGEIFFFNRNGKFKNSFVCKGGGPGEIHNRIYGCFWDAQNKEIYINDGFANRILVFNAQGKHLRTLSIEEEFSIGRHITDFDKKSFLIYDEKNMDTSDMYMMAQANSYPYVLLSKADGKKTGQLPFFIFKRLSSTFYRTIGSHFEMVGSSPAGIPFKRFGDELIICDLGLDDIYKFSLKTNTAVSLFSKVPKLQNQEFPKTVVELLDYNDKYVTFKRSVNYYDFDNKVPGESDMFVYDQQKKSFYRAKFSHKDLGVRYAYMSRLNNPVLPKNMEYDVITAEDLLESYQKGELKDSKLKEIASTMKEDDNDILVLTLYNY